MRRIYTVVLVIFVTIILLQAIINPRASEIRIVRGNCSYTLQSSDAERLYEIMKAGEEFNSYLVRNEKGTTCYFSEEGAWDEPSNAFIEMYDEKGKFLCLGILGKNTSFSLIHGEFVIPFSKCISDDDKKLFYKILPEWKNKNYAIDN